VDCVFTIRKLSGVFKEGGEMSTIIFILAGAPAPVAILMILDGVFLVFFCCLAAEYLYAKILGRARK
jgi:hypothetical protein